MGTRADTIAVEFNEKFSPNLMLGVNNSLWASRI